MKRIPTLFVGLACAVLASAAPALAQGIITDGDVNFEYTAFDVLGGSFANFEVDDGTDHLFSQWWYYRVAGDSFETVFPVPDVDAYVGNVATLGWANVDGRGFSAREVITLSDVGVQAAVAQIELTVTNDDASPLTLSVFHYTDFDLDASAGSDAAIALPPTTIGVMETSIGTFHGFGGDDYQAEPFANLRNLLEDNLFTDLSNSGLPFGPGDWTGAIQWREITIPSGASITYTVGKGINARAVGLELVARDACPGTVRLLAAGAEPAGTVEYWGGPSLGSFAIPDGDCAGLELGLDSATSLGTATAGANGRALLELSLDGVACDQVVQAVDLTSCAATNVDPIQ